MNESERTALAETSRRLYRHWGKAQRAYGEALNRHGIPSVEEDRAWRLSMALANATEAIELAERIAQEVALEEQEQEQESE